MQHHRAFLHRLAHVLDERQDFVLDLDQRRGFLGHVRILGRHGGHGMAVVEHGVLGDAVVGDVLHADAAALAGRNHGLVQRRKIGAGDDRLDARQGHRLADVDALDAGVRMRTAHDLAVQHVRQVHVVAKLGLAGDLVDAVAAYRGRTQHTPLTGFVFGFHVHYAASIALLAFRTARTSLS